MCERALTKSSTALFVDGQPHYETLEQESSQHSCQEVFQHSSCHPKFVFNRIVIIRCYLYDFAETELRVDADSSALDWQLIRQRTKQADY